MLYTLHIKRILTMWPLLVLILICQIGLGYLASFALRDQTPQLILAVYTEDKGDSFTRFKESLAAIPELTLIEADSEAAVKKMARRQEVLGAVIIDKDLNARITKGRNAVRFVPSPGSAGGRVVKEHVAAAVVALKAEDSYRREIRGLGGEAADLRSVYEPVLTVKYDGPPLLINTSSFSPGYGIPALFILILSLFGALTLPGPDSRRALLKGVASLFKDFVSGMAALLTLGAFILSAFFISCRFLYDAPPSLVAIVSFAALCIYCVSFGALIAALNLRKIAVWIFIPWLLLNMTLGGGLWGIPFSAPIVGLFLPITQVLLGCEGYLFGIINLSAAALGFIVLSTVLASTFTTYICISNIFKNLFGYGGPPPFAD